MVLHSVGYSAFTGSLHCSHGNCFRFTAADIVFERFKVKIAFFVMCDVLVIVVVGI